MRPIKIFEIGPGTGILAQSIIEFMKNYSHSNKIEYHLIEISEMLCKNALSKRFENEKGVSINIHNKSIFEYNDK